MEARSVSDDDLCVSCKNLLYAPGFLSICMLCWPGNSDQDGSIHKCRYHELEEPQPYISAASICRLARMTVRDYLRLTGLDKISPVEQRRILHQEGFDATEEQ